MACFYSNLINSEKSTNPASQWKLFQFNFHLSSLTKIISIQLYLKLDLIFIRWFHLQFIPEAAKVKVKFSSSFLINFYLHGNISNLLRILFKNERFMKKVSILFSNLLHLLENNLMLSKKLNKLVKMLLFASVH